MRITVTGVQKKLSLGIEKRGKEARLTIVGLCGHFILKPRVEEYPFLPENEDAVMRLASLFGIPVVPHAMIRLASGELSFVSRRIDRDEKGGKIAMEDFCQLSGRLTEDKYKGSAERIGKALRLFSVYPGLDAVGIILGIGESAVRKIFRRTIERCEEMLSLVKSSRLEKPMRDALSGLIGKRIAVFSN